MHEAVDLFAGPGGWDVGARALGLAPLGIELNPDACATREAAGHLTVRADVAALEPMPARLLIGSPPCPTFSNSGSRDGIRATEIIAACARELGRGNDTRRAARIGAFDALLPSIEARERARAERRREHYNAERAHAATIRAAEMSLLVVEPLRWALATRPALVALEQVPGVLPLWRLFADVLTYHGWACWAGVLNAADYGVPQTRERALLLAARGRSGVLPPSPTHCRGGALTLEGELAPWVSMAEALGWEFAARAGFPRRNDRDDGGAYRERDLRDTDEPAFALTEKARSWVVNTGRDWKEGGSRADAQVVPLSEPAPAVAGTSLIGWQLRPGLTDSQPNRRLYDVADEPAPTVAFGKDSSSWCWENEGEGEVLRLEVSDAAALQTFRRDYPFQGTRSSQFRQVSNAVPPLLAEHVLGALL